MMHNKLIPRKTSMILNQKVKLKKKKKQQNFANLLLCHAEIRHYTCSKRIAIYSVSNTSRGDDRVF